MDVQEDLYDEFGNYIGPEIDSDEDGDAPEIEDGDDESGDEEERMEYDGEQPLLEDAAGGGEEEGRVVLHEDKKYYPTAMEVYGEEVETTVQDEDTMPITQGVVAAIKAKNFDIVEKKQPTHVYSQEFLVSMMKHPNLVRNVAVIGHLHHGKTTFVDMLVDQTHYFEAPKTGVQTVTATQKEDRRYTDSRVDEQQRGLSIKASPMTMLLQASSEKHYLFNIMDTCSSRAIRGAPPGQSPSSAPAPPRGAPGSSGWRGAPTGEAGPLGAQPLPRVLERAASKATDFPAHFPAFAPPGRATSTLATRPRLACVLQVSLSFSLRFNPNPNPSPN